MRTLKRMLAALMALTMVGVLGACGSGSDDSKSASSSEAESAYKEKDDVAIDASLVDEEQSGQKRCPVAVRGQIWCKGGVCFLYL